MARNQFMKYQNEKWLIHEYSIKKRTTRDIANEFNVGMGTIRRWLNKFDIPMRNRPNWLDEPQKKKKAYAKAHLTLRSKEHREKMSQKMKKKHEDAEYKKHYREAYYGKTYKPSDNDVKKSSVGRIGKWAYCRLSCKAWLEKEYLTKKHSTYTIAKWLSKKAKRMISDETVRAWLHVHNIPTRTHIEWSQDVEKIKNAAIKRSVSMKELYFDDVYLHNLQMGLSRRPTNPELELDKILKNMFPKEYRYVGNLSHWIGGKNPDFININGKRKAIELFGDYWHRNDDPQERINHFRNYGYEALVVWECELKNKSLLKQKLLDFHGV